MNLIIESNNFDILKNIFSSTFNDEEIKYKIFYDKLKSDQKKILAKIDLPKNNIEIITTNPTKIPKKYKHQIIKEKDFNTPDIKKTLKEVFGNDDRDTVLAKLSQFQNRHIFIWLEMTSVFYPELAEGVFEIEQFVDTKFFKQIVVEKFMGTKYIPRYIR